MNGRKTPDKIIIKDARFYCKTGVREEERKQKQELRISLEIFCDLSKGAKTDDIKDTINYSDVYKLLEQIISKNRFKLLESLAEDISKKIFENFNAGKITVKIIKSNALKNKADKCGIEITRTR
ncbi:MAG TPA: dihydroneopterin aldolase [Candidatus Nanoarchaeia archaeon]|nr:dihydroneopterin aldolase [Candidatus Nanoarchaeia archaeon]